MAQEVSRISTVSIAFVLDPRQAARSRVCQQLVACHTQQRTQHTLTRFRHGAGAAHAGAAQQIVQNGFSLIIGVVRKQNPVCRMLSQGLVTHTARRRLETLTATEWNDDRNHGQRDTEFIATLGTGSDPCVRIGAQAVVNMEP